MDGPASYRDRSGQIHELRYSQQVRLDVSSSSSYHLPFLIPPQNSRLGVAGTVPGVHTTSESSLGELIMAGATANNHANNANSSNTHSSNNKSPTKSTLASMMQGKSPPLMVNATPIVPPLTNPTVYPHYEQQGLYDDDDAAAAATGAFSTSLTGLEILQNAAASSGGQYGQAAAAFHFNNNNSNRHFGASLSNSMPAPRYFLPDCIEPPSPLQPSSTPSLLVAHEPPLPPQPIPIHGVAASAGSHFLHDDNDEDNHHHDVFELEME